MKRLSSLLTLPLLTAAFCTSANADTSSKHQEACSYTKHYADAALALAEEMDLNPVFKNAVKADVWEFCQQTLDKGNDQYPGSTTFSFPTTDKASAEKGLCEGVRNNVEFMAHYAKGCPQIEALITILNKDLIEYCESILDTKLLHAIRTEAQLCSGINHHATLVSKIADEWDLDPKFKDSVAKEVGKHCGKVIAREGYQYHGPAEFSFPLDNKENIANRICSHVVGDKEHYFALPDPQSPTKIKRVKILKEDFVQFCEQLLKAKEDL